VYKPNSGFGDVLIMLEGQAPTDGFTEYFAFGEPYRPRWGDYSQAYSDGKKIWLATEYINSNCTFAEYSSDPLSGSFNCPVGGIPTRTSLANWSTGVGVVKP